MPHRIRLRGPWELDSATNCFTRRFHQPTGLSPTTRVWLVIDEANTLARIELNGTALGQAIPGHSARFDITASLKPQNLLAIALVALQPDAKTQADGPVGLVSLEIEESSA
jgi:hypothetical protein